MLMASVLLLFSWLYNVRVSDVREEGQTAIRLMDTIKRTMKKPYAFVQVCFTTTTGIDHSNCSLNWMKVQSTIQTSVFNRSCLNRMFRDRPDDHFWKTMHADSGSECIKYTYSSGSLLEFIMTWPP